MVSSAHLIYKILWEVQLIGEIDEKLEVRFQEVIQAREAAKPGSVEWTKAVEEYEELLKLIPNPEARVSFPS